MLVMDRGMMILPSDEHPENAELPIEVRLCLREISEREEQPANAPSLIEVVVSGIVMDKSEVQSLKVAKVQPMKRSLP